MTIDNKSREDLLTKVEELRLRLEETEEVLRAIQSGEVDALVVSRPEGEQIFTLQGAEHPYRVLVESMDEGAANLAQDGTILFCNRYLAAMLQIPLEKLTGSQLISHVAPADHSLFACRLEKCSDEHEKEEITLITGAGTTLPALFSCFPVTLSSSQRVGVVLTDVSARKQAEQKLNRLNDELEKRVKELGETSGRLERETAERFRVLEELRGKEQLLIQQSRMAGMGEMLVNISHQWRQPLNVLGLKIQEIGLSYELGGFSKELLDANIEKSMEILRHLSQTIDDFRDFSSPDKEKSTFRVDHIVGKAVSLIVENFTALGIAIEVSSSGEPQINGYPNEYGQVLINILMNAKDALVEKHISNARIRLHSWTEDYRAVLTITDNAGGINEAIIDSIFDPYFTTKDLGKGTGIGLFMSKTIIEKNMAGHFSVHNVESGAEFRIEV